MNMDELEPGVLIEARVGSGFVEARIDSLSSGKLTATKIKSGTTFSADLSRLNFDWKVLKSKVLPGVGKVDKNCSLRLGRKVNKTFIPGSVTLFVSGFIEQGDSLKVVGKNLNLNLCKKLDILDYGKTWVVD